MQNILEGIKQRSRINRGSHETNTVSEPPKVNSTLFEAFEWYSASDGQHWKRLQRAVPSLAALGIDLIWLPPGCKASHPNSNGYDIYDLYDLGEFDQKSHVATKWGSKDDLLACCHVAREHRVGLLWDAVLNHRAAADYTQVVNAVEVDPADRTVAIAKPKEIEAWLGWRFQGRGGKYSNFTLDKHHFNATDWDQREQKHAIYRITDEGKQWAKDVDADLGNFDFLLLNNHDLSREDLRKDMVDWAEWIGKELGLSGMRFDAAKHMSRSFMKGYVDELDKGAGKEWFYVAEYCTDKLERLVKYIDQMNGRIHLFDFPLHGHFVSASKAQNPDLRILLKGTLLEERPQNTVTHVTNHDSQDRDQDFDTTVEDYFIPMAYALILFHKSSRKPCVFHGDLYGVNGPHGVQGPTCYGRLARMILARKLWAYGPQQDYFDERSCIGFTRGGHQAHSDGAGLAVLINVSGSPARKRMSVGPQHAGERWTDVLGQLQYTVVLDKHGAGDFPVGGKKLGLWACQDAKGRAEVDALSM